MPPRDRLEQIGLFALVGIVAALQLSIAAAQILLALASLAFTGDLPHDVPKREPDLDESEAPSQA